MADENKLEFKLSIDGKEAEKSVDSIGSKIKDLGKGGFELIKSNLETIVTGFVAWKGALALVNTGISTLEKSFEIIKEVELQKKIGAQFDALTSSAGVLASELKENVLKAVQGLATEGDTLQAVNKALIEMPQNASRIPEIMEVARKSASLFGGDVIQNFEDISHAIAVGQTRMLKNYGIIVDQEKAYKKYAESIGVAVKALSEQEKQTALMNEVLDQANKRYVNVDAGLTKNTKTFKQIKVLVDEVSEALKFLFEEVFGNVVYKTLSVIKTSLSDLNRYLRSNNDSIDGLNNTVSRYTDKLKEKQEQLKQINKLYEQKIITEADYKARLTAVNNSISEYTKKLDEAKTKLSELKKIESEKVEKPQVDNESLKLRKDQELKFQAELNKIRQSEFNEYLKHTQTLELLQIDSLEKRKFLMQKNQDEINAIRRSDEFSESQKLELIAAKNQELHTKLAALETEANNRKIQLINEQINKATSLADAELLFEQKKFEIGEQFRLQKELIKQNEQLNEMQRKQAELELDQLHKQQLLQAHIDFEKQKEQVTQNSVAAAEGAAEKFAAGFAKAAASARSNLSNFGAHGAQVFGMFTNHAANAFMKLGEGSKRGSQVMREAMFGMIADVAQYYGTMMLAAGVFPPNPAALAGGAALLALAGFLRSKASGATAFNTGGVGGMGGGAEMGNVGLSGQQVQQEERKDKVFQVNIMGNYFETEQTKTRLLEIMREASDATDFKYQKIGGGI